MSALPVEHANCQIAVIGSGFPGSIMALILARLGYDVVVIDKSSHPRFAIGESSTPIADAYLAKIAGEFGIPELLPLSTFPRTRLEYPDLTVGRKRGFSYFWHERDEPFTYRSDHQNELVVAASSSDELADSHWLRSEVDHQIVRWFDDYNVKYLDNCTVNSIRRRTNQWEIEFSQSGNSGLMSANYFVDASGVAGVGIKAQGGQSKRQKMWTNTSAVFAHFNDLKRWSEMAPAHHRSDYPFVPDDAAVHHLIRSGWMWQLRFHTGLTSCGIVQANLKSFGQPNKTSPHQEKLLNQPEDPAAALEFFRETISRYPSLQFQFQNARTITPPGGAFFRERLQHWYDLGSGSGWCALPHTIGFVDPLHSKGLAHALSGVYRLARIFSEENLRLDGNLDRNVSDRVEDFQKEIGFLDRLIGICYLSLESFDLFRLATLWYFAAATNFEYRSSVDNNYNRPFLLANDEDFRLALYRYADELRATGGNVAGKTSRMQELAKSLLQPFDRVGLFSPRVHNMYPNTSAPENTKST